ncbi:type II secretion system protein GspN [Myxococcus sp. K38C18041901]|uniref:type II secretion system protein GspN n=1 Tax=Myxococcus guangdongensis TaxID=2906760 RepID=UPI0020A73FD1|nr:type II secretion system protein GspN [Myxococcus guangdongensis]MCP3060592.1 type II secretion system protein GspN [Myxococcus guangdongensis]
MSSDSKPARWKVILGYGAFALVAFVLCLLLTFPYETVRARIISEAAQAGLAVRIGSLRPGLSGVTATNVKVSKPPQAMSADLLGKLISGEGLPGAAELGEAVIIDSLAVRPTLFPPGVAVRAHALGGTVTASVGVLGDSKVRADIDGLKASGGNLPGFLGVDLDGVINGTLALTLPKGKSPEPDLSLANGELTLDTQGLIIKGGKASIPMGGGNSMPMDLPQVALGALVGRINFDKGLGTVQELKLKGEDIEALATGTLKLGKRLEYSEPAMDVNLRLDPEAQKRLGLLAAGITIFPPDKKDPSFRAARLGGFLNRPTFLPRR